MFESEDLHDDSLGVRMFGLKESMKSKIREVVLSGHKSAKLVMHKLEVTMPEALPPVKQLRNFLLHRNRASAKPIVYIRDLKQWCQARLLPNDDDEAFVVSEDYNYHQEWQF